MRDKKREYNAQISPKSEPCRFKWANVSKTLYNWQICHQTHVLCVYPKFGTELNWVPNSYGPYARCSLALMTNWPSPRDCSLIQHCSCHCPTRRWSRLPRIVHFCPYPPPPPCQWPGPCFFFRERGAICKGGHVSSFDEGGPLTRARGAIDANSHQNSKTKLFVYAFSSLRHRCKRGGDQCLVPLASLRWLWSSCWPPFAIFLCFYNIVVVVLNLCFPCLSFFTHTSTQ